MCGLHTRCRCPIILSFTSIEWAPVRVARKMHLSVYAVRRPAVQNDNGCIIGTGAQIFLSHFATTTWAPGASVVLAALHERRKAALFDAPDSVLRYPLRGQVPSPVGAPYDRAQPPDLRPAVLLRTKERPLRRGIDATSGR